MTDLQQLWQRVQELQKELTDVKRQVSAALSAEQQEKVSPLDVAIKNFLESNYEIGGEGVKELKLVSKLFWEFKLEASETIRKKVTRYIFESKVKDLVGLGNYGMFSPDQPETVFKLKPVKK